MSFVTPGDRAEVRLPVTIEWTVSDFDVTGPDGSARRDAGSFGVYIDRTPQPPGEKQEWLVRNDQMCKNDPVRVLQHETSSRSGTSIRRPKRRS